MKISRTLWNGIHKVSINDYIPVVDYKFPGKSPDNSQEFYMVKEIGESLRITMSLAVREHVLGLGERAYDIDRRMGKFKSWNSDAFAYEYRKDPLYVSIPFFMTVLKGSARGYFVNFPGLIDFDFGVENYDKITITVHSRSADFYIIDGPSIESVIERYTDLTGKPFLPPRWSLEHQISRYSYYPQEKALEILDEYLKEFRVGALYLDIDYQDSYNTFTWSSCFPDPEKFRKDLQSRDVKLVTIVDPYVKVDQNLPLFKESLGFLCQRETGELYVERSWPGLVAFPDFYDSRTRKWWSTHVSRWLRTSADGIWIDMNEPSPSANWNLDRDHGGMLTHRIGDRIVPHSEAANAFPYFEAMATFAGAKKAMEEPFVLSRSGYSGIQSFAAIWTGDNTSGTKDLKLQISLIASLSLSGLPISGCDLGGFIGKSDPDLVELYYRMALFFPFYRNHKAKGENDQELFRFPEKIRDSLRKCIDLRYYFIPYIYSIEMESHLSGHPVIRPLCYEFADDEDTYIIDDQYMIGRSLMYAPLLESGKTQRTVYLPDGEWFNFWSGIYYSGPAYITSNDEYPLYIRNGSAFTVGFEPPFDLVVAGNAEFHDSVAGKIRHRKGSIDLERSTEISKVFYYSFGEDQKGIRHEKEIGETVDRISIDDILRGKPGTTI